MASVRLSPFSRATSPASRSVSARLMLMPMAV
jgi:hypothetical protein